MPTFTEVLRSGEHPLGSMWRINTRPADVAVGAVLMKIRAADITMLVCVHPGRDGLPVRGATYTSGTRGVEPVNVEVEHADHA